MSSLLRNRALETQVFGIVQKVFSEKASAMRQECVRNASEMGLVLIFIGKRGAFRNASEMRQNRVKNARNTFGGEHLLDDTEVSARFLL